MDGLGVLPLLVLGLGAVPVVLAASALSEESRRLRAAVRSTSDVRAEWRRVAAEGAALGERARRHL